MNPLKLKKRIKTFVALGIALLLTATISPRLFIADSPQINTQFIAELRNAPADFVAFVMRRPTGAEATALAELEQSQVQNVPQGLTFAPVAQGVSAAEDPSTGERFVKVEAGTKLEVRQITLEDGRTVTVYVPVE